MYQTLNDAPLPELKVGPVKIWYAHLPTFYEAKRTTLAQTHVLLGSVCCQDPETLFQTLQAEYWSPQGEARPLLEKLGLFHTSMSVGDCIEYPDGRVLMVSFIGFKELEDA